MLLLLCFVLQPAGAAFLSGDNAPGPLASPTSHQDTFKWPAWSRDADVNRLDDELDYWLAHSGPDDLPVLVCFDRMPSPGERRTLEGLGGHVTYVSKFLPFLTAGLPRSSIETVRDMPGVERIEAATPLELTLDTSVSSISADKVWKSLGLRGEGTVICVIDSGMDGNHSALDDMDDNNATRDPKIIAFYDAADSPGTTDGSTKPFDRDGHGTHVSAIAAGTGHGEPDFKYIGVAPGARLVGVKILRNDSTSMSTDDAIRGIEWAMSNKDKFGIGVVSMSFGAKFVAPGITNDGTSAMSQLVDRAVESGLVCVAAAGNSGPVKRSITPPGDAKLVITVGNVRDDHTLNPSSSRGPVGRLTNSYVKPDVCGPGTDVYSAQANSGNKFVSETGTSQACPHLSGVAALMLEALPSLRPGDVMSILRSTAEPEKSFPWQSSPNNDYGYGTVNALRAVENCTNGTLPPVVHINPMEKANGTVVLTGTAASARETVKSVEVRIDSGAYATAAGTTTWSYVWNTTPYPNGLHYAVARAFDGKVYSYEFRMAVQVDNLFVDVVPVPVTNPLRGEVTFTGTADGEVQQVQVRIDNRSWENAQDTANQTYHTWKYTVNTTHLANGIHRLEARAYDGSRYSTLSGMEFAVQNPPKPAKAGKLIPGMGFGIAAISLASAAAVLCLLRRR